MRSLGFDSSELYGGLRLCLEKYFTISRIRIPVVLGFRVYGLESRLV